MCHTDIPPGQATPNGSRAEVEVPLPSNEAMSALHTGSDDGVAGVLVIGDVFGRSSF